MARQSRFHRVLESDTPADEGAGFWSNLRMNSSPRTAIVSALHDELASVLALMPDEQKQTVGGREFWVGHLHGQDVVAVLSGIGKVAAATTATLLIQHFKV